MINKLKSVFLLESGNFADYKPSVPNNFHVTASLTIGPEDREVGSDYSIEICTPLWLDHHIQQSGPVVGRHMLVVNDFDAGEIRHRIENIISQCEVGSEAETQNRLGRFFFWDFEDFES